MHSRRRLDPIPQGLPMKHWHHDEGLALVFAKFVNAADVGMVQPGSGTGFTLQPVESRGVGCKFRRQELHGHAATQLEIFGFVDDAHTATAQKLQHTVVRYLLAEAGFRSEAPLRENFLLDRTGFHYRSNE